MKLNELLNVMEEGREVTLTDTAVDVEFYVYADKTSIDKEDYCEQVTRELIKKLQVKKILEHGTVIVDVYKLVKKNLQLFKDFSKEHWNECLLNEIYFDDEELVCAWVEDIANNYFVGNYSENTYKNFFLEVVQNLK